MLGAPLVVRRETSVLCFSETQEFTYLEEYPVRLIDRLPVYAGHNALRIIVIQFEYGKDFSGPGKDIFRTSRATGEPAEGHLSNFLHPVFYYYKEVPTGTH